MYKRILVAIDLNDDPSWRGPLVAGAEHARKFAAELIVLTVVREVEAILQARGAPIAYKTVVGYLESQLRDRVAEAQADDLHPMKDYLLGTNAGRVVRHAHCSVLVAREPA